MLQELQRPRPLPPSVSDVQQQDETYAYDAFISYSRKDQAFAQLLEQRLEAYPPPRGLGLPARHLRVFLDTSDIRGADYNETIERELRRSKTLIVVCSPAARASGYVNDEIRRFIAMRRAEGRQPEILPLLLDGIPNNEAKTPDDEERQGFPEALYEAAKMPLAQSYLGFDPNRHKLDRGGYRDAWFAALAALLDVDRHELEERDARRRAQTRKIVAVATLIVLAAISGLAAFAWIQRGEAIAQRSEAIAQRDQALRQESRVLAALAQDETSADNPVEGMLLALRGMPIADADEPRPLVAETRQALMDAVLAQRELLVLRSSESWVRAVAFSPDGGRIVSGSDTVRVWDAANGEELLAVRGSDLLVTATAFSPDGARIVSGSRDGTVRVWDAANGQGLLTLRGHELAVVATAFSPDGARIVSVSEDGTARVWDAASGQQSMVRSHEDMFDVAAFSTDGGRIVSGFTDGTVQVWDATSGQNLLALHAHETPVSAAGFSADGNRIVSGSWDGTVRLWDAASGAEVMVLRGHEDWVNAAAFSPDGARIVSGSNDGTVRVWDASSEAEVMVLRGHEGPVTAAAFSPDGTRIVSGSQDGTVRVWDAASGKEPLVLSAHGEGGVKAAAFSLDGMRILSGSGSPIVDVDAATVHKFAGAIRLWDAASGEGLLVLRGHEAAVNAAAFSPDGTRVLSGSADNTLRVWYMESGEEMLVLGGHEGPVNATAFSPDGARVVSGSADNTVRVWDAASGELLLVVRGHEGPVNAAAFSPNGTLIVSGSDDRTVRVWDAATGAELLVLSGHVGAVFAAGFALDGARIVSGSLDSTVRVWDAASGKQLLELNGHGEAVNSAAFSPDGTRVVSASGHHPSFSQPKESDDNTVRVWDAASGEALLILRGHEKAVNAAAFSPDGERIVSVGDDGTARVWFVGKDDADLVAHACARLPRDLSSEAIERFNLDPDAPWPCAERAKTLWPHPVQAAIAPAAGPANVGGAAAQQ